MKLITAHRILIGTAAVFFFFFAGWELTRFWSREDFWAGGRALLYLAVSIGFAVYLKSLKRWYP